MLHSKGSGSICGNMVRIRAESKSVSPHVKPSGICLGVDNYTFLRLDIKGIAKMRQNQEQRIHGEKLSRAYPGATES